MANRLTIHLGKEDYIIEFNRSIVVSMEDRGITPDAISAKPMNTIPRFFLWGLKMHRPKIKQEEADEVWDAIVGKEELVPKMIEMWANAQDSLMQEPEGDDAKKATWEIG